MLSILSIQQKTLYDKQRVGATMLEKMTPEKIRELLVAGESESVEFKTRFVSDRSIAPVLSAFANTSGGTLLIGIDGEGGIIGLSVEEVKETQRRLLMLLSSLFPPDLYRSAAVQVDGKWVVYAHVEKAESFLVPVRISSGQVFFREQDRTIQELEKRNELLIPRQESPQRLVRVFVAMSFRTEEEPALVDYYKAMERAVAKTRLPLELHRIDLDEGDFEISQQIMNDIDECDILLADFTLSPGNVYFEVGYARGKGVRVIQTARKDTVLMFDVRNWQTKFYKNATELEATLVPAFQKAYEEVFKKQG